MEHTQIKWYAWILHWFEVYVPELIVEECKKIISDQMREKPDTILSNITPEDLASTRE